MENIMYGEQYVSTVSVLSEWMAQKASIGLLRAFDSPPVLVSGSHSLIIILATVPIARVDETGFVLSTRIWNLLYSKIYVWVF